MKSPLCYLGWFLAGVLLLVQTCREVRQRPVVRPEPSHLSAPAPSPVDVNAELRDELAACLRQNDFITQEKWACDRRVFALREALTSCGVGMDAGADR